MAENCISVVVVGLWTICDYGGYFRPSLNAHFTYLNFIEEMHVVINEYSHNVDHKSDAGHTATQYDRLLASSCRPSVRLSVCYAVHCGSQGRWTG